jgi:SAM-dependent methyltransferase
MAPGKEQQGLYADPALYDILYTPGTAREVDVLEKVERDFTPGGKLRQNRLWLEPACGTGRYLRVAAGRGRRCVGFDLDEGQLEYARRRKSARPIKYHRADMRDFVAACGLKPASVAFAFNPVNSLRHLDSDRALLEHLQQMATVLAPGAVYVVGISLTDYDWLSEEEDLWEGRRGSCHVSQLVNYLPPEPGTPRARIETVLSHLTVTRPSGVQHLDDRYDLRCYDEEQWSRLIGHSALARVGSFDAHGRPLDGRRLPYQLEVLQRP